MVNTWGQWTAEMDYKTYPKEKWCDMDRIANYIKEQNYTPKTTIENLAEMIVAHYEGETEDGDSMFKFSVNFLDNVVEFVNASGGLEEFDYYC